VPADAPLAAVAAAAAAAAAVGVAVRVAGRPPAPGLCCPRTAPLCGESAARLARGGKCVCAKWRSWRE
jgi:hypothetical protein